MQLYLEGRRRVGGPFTEASQIGLGVSYSVFFLEMLSARNINFRKEANFGFFWQTDS
jgi:hypothetical protein